MSSHNQLSKNRYINAFYGNLSAILSGFTFAVFKSTHLLHHRFPTDPEKDPDYAITNGSNQLFIPLKIWYHDRFFWRKGLWRSNTNWRGYFINRLVQVSLVGWFYVSGNINKWIIFWLVPIMVIGTLNGLFLFYFPHYSSKFEDKWRPKRKQLNFIQNFILLIIDISRNYHSYHHDNVAGNANYFPVYTFFRNRFKFKTTG